ncbi:MAG: hypothetical protein JNK15_07670 [Planctomycetes bacterium]|nr:hypothetical protein [Planctomycetota bacterium]
MVLAGWLLSQLVARLHGLLGWVAYRLGCRARARRHWERVLALRGADFRAYVHLGRIAFDIGDYAGWRRELEHARRLDPERFSRLRHPLELFEPRLAGTQFDRETQGQIDFDGTGTRATWRSLRPTAGGKGQTQPNDSLDAGLDALLPGLDTGKDAAEDRRGFGDGFESCDDCATASERQRFRTLGPIQSAEIAHCDLDELLRKLSG